MDLEESGWVGPSSFRPENNGAHDYEELPGPVARHNAAPVVEEGTQSWTLAVVLDPVQSFVEGTILVGTTDQSLQRVEVAKSGCAGCVGFEDRSHGIGRHAVGHHKVDRNAEEGFRSQART